MNSRIIVALMAAVVAGYSSSVQAADLITAPSLSPGIVVETTGRWDGAFVGLYSGYATGELVSPVGGINGTTISGMMLGIAAGANFAITDGVVAGVVGDVGWNNYEANGFPFTSGWNGSLRGRVGLDAGAFLPYLTAGLAVANGDGGITQNVHIGWTAGAGVELAVTDQASLDLLYRYSDYAQQSYSGNDVGAKTHAISLGLNWKF